MRMPPNILMSTSGALAAVVVAFHCVDPAAWNRPGAAKHQRRSL
jgi:hypothetical protein